MPAREPRHLNRDRLRAVALARLQWRTGAICGWLCSPGAGSRAPLSRSPRSVLPVELLFRDPDGAPVVLGFATALGPALSRGGPVLEIRPLSGRPGIRATGEINVITRSSWEQALADLASAHGDVSFVELSGLLFIDVGGVAALAVTAQQLATGRIVVDRPPPELERVPNVPGSVVGPVPAVGDRCRDRPRSVLSRGFPERSGPVTVHAGSCTVPRGTVPEGPSAGRSP